MSDNPEYMEFDDTEAKEGPDNPGKSQSLPENDAAAGGEAADSGDSKGAGGGASYGGGSTGDSGGASQGGGSGN